MKRDRRVDEYISSAPDFARPILKHLRELVHTACPDVDETIKWSRPHFLHNGILCGMSAFKHHCAFGFWMGEMVRGAKGKPTTEGNGMGHFGRIISLADLPGDNELLALIRKAAALNKSGAKRRVASRPAANRTLVLPEYFTAALRKNKKALAAFEAFSYSHKKEYVEWITEAKRDETRQSRIETMLAWLAEGKSRNWKYSNC
ncbi:MAG: YdeI/OmpD-associated family protein [Limisphaerales bacterium]